MRPISVTFYPSEFKALASMMNFAADENTESILYTTDDLSDEEMKIRIIQNSIAAKVLYSIASETINDN